MGDSREGGLDRLSVRCLGCAFGPKNVNYAFLT